MKLLSDFYGYAKDEYNGNITYHSQVWFDKSERRSIVKFEVTDEYGIIMSGLLDDFKSITEAEEFSEDFVSIEESNMNDTKGFVVLNQLRWYPLSDGDRKKQEIDLYVRKPVPVENINLKFIVSSNTGASIQSSSNGINF